jgi:adenylate cyclase
MADQVFVGRDRELARLRTILGRGLAGHGQVVFITGEAGSGKTALVSAFTEDAQQQVDDLIVAIGSCSAQGRIGDPYLPFREVLAVLTGGPGEQSVHPKSNRLGNLLVRSTQVLVEVGPDLIGTLIPGSSLIAKIGKVAVEKMGWMDDLKKLDQKKREPAPADQPAMEQGRIFEQYANVLKAIAHEHPLVIVIDDLQWADEASIGLFFHLSRRLETSRILLVGTYRPDEVEAVGGARHPLEKVLTEIKRYAGDVWIDLGQTQELEKKTFINQFLDSEPNRLGNDFREHVYQHTGGHPLFTVELLRSMQERGDLIKDTDGSWTLGPSLDWNTLPARVEGVIEERIGRLSATEREILDIGSVQGQVFTAEVVGQVSQMQMRQMLRELSQELERQYKLVQEAGSLKAGRTLLASYQFAHALFQRYVYGELSTAEKRLLHGEVARALELLYAGQTDQISAQLSWHFDQAGDVDRAVPYLVRSGELANAQGAPQAARGFFNRALELLLDTQLGEVLELRDLHWQALLGRHTALLRIGDPEALKADTEALEKLASQSADPGKRAEAAYRKLLYANSSGDSSTILTAADEAITAARDAHDLRLEARSLQLKATVQIRCGDTLNGQETAMAALACARETGDDTVLANALAGVANAHAAVGDLSKSVQVQLEALEAARRGESRINQARILANLGDDYRRLGLYDLAQTTLEQALQANETIGARRERAYVLNILGATHIARGQDANARPLLEEALGESISIGDQYLKAECTKLIGYVHESLGNLSGAMAYFLESRAQLEALKNTGSMLEAVAGLARVALALGQHDLAGSHAQELWDDLSQHGMDSLFPEANLACASVFTALGRPEAARTALEGAYQDLIARADKISDPVWRKSFLENVPENAQLLQAYRNLPNPS